MRRPAALLSLALLAAALLLRRRHRRLQAGSLGVREPAPPLAPPASGVDFASVPWTLVAAPADEPGLTIRYRDDARTELDRVDAQETPTQVFVTVLLRRRAPAGDRFGEQEVDVPLSGPLGDRELVHAPVDEPRGP